MRPVVRLGSVRSTPHCIRALSPGVWVDANELAEQMLTQHLLRSSPGFMLSSRLLPEDHFDFRGAEPAGRRRIARTRRSDPAA